MSGFNPNNRYGAPPTDDINQIHGGGIANVNIVSNMNEINNRTGERLFQSVIENPRSSELIINSSNRTRGTIFDFTTDIGGPLYRARTARLAAAVIPAIPNINRRNNEVRMQMMFNSSTADSRIYYPLDIAFTIPVGYYSPARFSDVFGDQLRAAILSLVGSDIAEVPSVPTTESINSFSGLAVVVNIEPDTFRPVIIVSANSTDIFTTVGGGAIFSIPGFPFSFWFDPTCSFITHGIHMVPFLGANPYPINTTPDTTNVDAFFPTNSSSIGTDAVGRRNSFLRGLPASFYYSRFITVISENLSLYTFGESRVDRRRGGGGTGKIIGVFASVRYNGNANFIPYPGVDVIKNVEAPVLGINNAQLKLNELIDFRFEDEFGTSLDLVFPPDQYVGTTLAFNITY